MDRRVCWLAICVSAWLAGGCEEDPGGTTDYVCGDATPGELAEPIPVETAWISFEVRSAVLGQDWYSPGRPGRYTLELLEADGGCGALGEWTVGRGRRKLSAWIPGLTDGSCRPGVPCEASVVLDPGYAEGLRYELVGAEEALLTLTRTFSGRDLAGELRAWFPREPEVAVPVDGPDVLCVAMDGRTRRCTDDCCNGGKPLEEVVISFSAPLCPEAVSWGWPPWPGDPVASCEPPVDAPDCELACAHELALCHEWYACEEDDSWCIRWRDGECVPLGEACPATCAATASFPGFGTAFACLEATDTAEAWTACMASCGGDR